MALGDLVDLSRTNLGPDDAALVTVYGAAALTPDQPELGYPHFTLAGLQTSIDDLRKEQPPVPPLPPSGE